ncbi:MAG: hypothetical protein WBQ25_19645 [Nitrososphaeraceae archaeon]
MQQGEIIHRPQRPKTSSGGGGSNDVNGRNVYKLTGRSCPCQNEGEKTLHCSNCGPNDVTVRVNCNNCQLENYEATGIIQFSSQCGGGGDEATIKHLGPAGHHKQNPGCCWEMGTVTQGGKVGFNMEGGPIQTQRNQSQKTTET